MEIKTVQKAVIGFSKRAEKLSSDILLDTFVDTEPLADILFTSNNQIIYGRRGTGKTHALIYLSERIRKSGEHPIYIDLRSIGSDGSIYNDFELSRAERSVRLVVDVLKVIGAELWAMSVDALDTATHPDVISNRLDDLERAFTEVKIVGNVTAAEKTSKQEEGSGSASVGGEGSTGGLKGLFNLKKAMSTSEASENVRTSEGRERFSINFGHVQGALRNLLDVLGKPRVWVLVDEWSEIPPDLQPFLADLLRKTLLPLEGFVVKIAAIEHRATFYESKEGGEYIGLELGADISADLNLDDFLVFDNDQDRSIQFFKSLLHRHLLASGDFAEIKTPDDLVQTLFTQVNAFEELVRAAEGVPRDALNLASKVATKAFGKASSIPDIRVAARDWYIQDKASPVQAQPLLSEILDHIVGRVIGERRARAFMIESNTRNPNIDRLYDARVLHILKKNVSARDDPGERFDAFKIDYGCYVDLINTQKATGGLFQADEGGYVDVPVDDYRSIRRAILDLRDLDTIVRKHEKHTA